MAIALFSISIRREEQKQFAFIWDGQLYTFTVLSPGKLLSYSVIMVSERTWIIRAFSRISD